MEANLLGSISNWNFTESAQDSQCSEVTVTHEGNGFNDNLHNSVVSPSLAEHNAIIDDSNEVYDGWIAYCYTSH